MARYRYFIFNQRAMVPLGILQLACSTICIVCGFIEGFFRKDSVLRRTRIPIWTGMALAFPGILALFSSQRKNPIIVTAMIASAVLSWITTTVLIIYAALTLSYGEDDDEVFQHKTSEVIHVEYILSKFVQGANMIILFASVVGILMATIIAYLGCQSLPTCGCFDSTTGMQALMTEDHPPQMIELVSNWQDHSSVGAKTPARKPFEELF
ncbi:uncharacterized protein zgc:113425 isoform X2 [Leucoraja erinacea]|uniref:uncharacterized protein zgc:113425 isoform X2 n=1 Tax=Leucoraja erinaceus TaxID=7782 RepID=UPI002455B493|nr:uncharacterized protein zgc:113425 isoform X2 [Leucoraja erinacea]XP_055499543.1 uncharacterized protein zgc:113425 isoform X2 [Leucoraja erinacea]